MRLHYGLVVALALTQSAPAMAQSWTAEETGLVDAIMACWNKMLVDEDPQGFESGCGMTQETTYWWTPETTPETGLEWWRANNIAMFEDEELIAQDLRPLRIRIVGNMGHIWLHGIRTFRNRTGDRYTEAWRGLEIWQRVDDGWAFIGGMGTPDEM